MHIRESQGVAGAAISSAGPNVPKGSYLPSQGRSGIGAMEPLSLIDPSAYSCPNPVLAPERPRAQEGRYATFAVRARQWSPV